MLEIGMYQNNGCLYVGFISCEEDSYMQPFGDATVNLEGTLAPYYGYLDTNNMPGIEEIVQKCNLGTFTGMMKTSGFCQYPLYYFNEDKLKELCPDGVEAYEMSLGKANERKKPKSR